MATDRILLLADDLTGALEVGAKFSAAGVRSSVTTQPGLSSDEIRAGRDVLVVDVETRHASLAEAARRVYELARTAYGQGVPFLYKKTDSTLRGNIGAELAAMIEAYPGVSLLYAPAYPRLGRTVRGGSLFVDGVPVTDTWFAADPFHPVQESHVPTLLAAQCALPIESGRAGNFVNAEPRSIFVCDGETEADLEATARAWIGSSAFRLAAGPSGFAYHVARLLDLPRSAPSPLPTVRNALVVNGSLHQLSRQQIELARHDGLKFLNLHSITNGSPEAGWSILEQERGAGRATLEFAKGLARDLCKLLARVRFDALIVFGGDTAFSIVEAMGHPPMHPIGEVMDGIPISRIEAKTIGPHLVGVESGLFLVTKAGGFGPPDVLASIRRLIGES